MWECKYGKEPLDMRLCFLRLLRKAWLVALMAVLGAAVFGGIYFVSHVVYGPAREYKAESEFYIEYVNKNSYYTIHQPLISKRNRSGGVVTYRKRCILCRAHPALAAIRGGIL